MQKIVAVHTDGSRQVIEASSIVFDLGDQIAIEVAFHPNSAEPCAITLATPPWDSHSASRAGRWGRFVIKPGAGNVLDIAVQADEAPTSGQRPEST